MKLLYWVRNDLRIHDNRALAHVASASQAVLVYCVDPDGAADTGLGFKRMSPRRTAFLRANVQAFAQRVSTLGGQVVVRSGRPEDIVPALVAELGVDEAVWFEEFAFDERRCAERVRARLNIPVTTFHGATLLHPEDLPFDLNEPPPKADPLGMFTRFRQRVENTVEVRPLVPTPQALPPGWDHLTSDPDPWWPAEPVAEDPRASFLWHAGETAALARVEEYFFETHAVATYKETRNGLLERNAMTRFSPWLAIGALSPRHVWHELKRYEAQSGANESTYWVFFELLWRDFFAFVAAREGAVLFRRDGVARRKLEWSHDRDVFDRWRAGQTGEPFVDANMRELAATGWMSNRGRQNVASWLAKTAGIDWTWGARWFEAMLIDYDPCSNWGNWQYVAGVGHDPRDRVFNVRSQAERYDPDGVFVTTWLSSSGDF